MLKVLIAYQNLIRSQPLKQSLIESGFEVIGQIENTINLEANCVELKPDIAIIDIELLEYDSLENIYKATVQAVCPILIFTHDADKEKIKTATQAGVSAHVVGDVTRDRLVSVIDAAVARFEEIKSLRFALSVANTKLDERKIIERAKGLLMKQRALDEDEAYQLMRSMAMKKNMKLADLSHQLIETAKMLIV